jgi:RNA polymerase sigma-70 factor (ECF subfamily)
VDPGGLEPRAERADARLRRWRTSEVARLLETSEDAVNGALKRARAALASADLETEPPDSAEVERELLEGYVDAFERYDVDALVALLHEDAIVAMPPFELWLQGLTDIRTFLAGMQDEGGHDRVLATSANGCPAVAVYRPDRAGALEPYAIMVLEVTRDRIAAIHAFLDRSLFCAFGLAPGDQFSPFGQL